MAIGWTWQFQPGRLELIASIAEKKSHWRGYLLLVIILPGAVKGWRHGYVGPEQNAEAVSQLGYRSVPAVKPGYRAEPAK